jgi:hypothetical protein
LFGDARLIKHLFSFQHRFFGGLQHCVHAPDYAHGQDYVRVFAAFEQIAQHIIGNAPNKGYDFIVRGLFMFSFLY